MLEKPKKPKNPFKIASLLTWKQILIFSASFIGWTLDAFDFFLVTFAIKDISQEFGKSVTAVAGAITITLMMRPIGALIFGILADKFGRKIPLIADILIYSSMGVLTGFSQSYVSFMSFRAIFGVAMGGEWGLGAALAMESLPIKARGLFSGILQQGYAFGYLLAAVFYFTIYPRYGWRAMFWFSSIPAVLCIFVRIFVPESEVWKTEKSKSKESSKNWFFEVFIKNIINNWKRLIYCIVLMSCFNFMSHGSQDLFPTFLKVQLGYETYHITTVVIIANLGAICGGTTLGYLSEYFGRRRTMIVSCVFAGCFIPLWILMGHNIYVLSVGVFIVQFFIQGAWGSIPAYLNELSPSSIRGTFPGIVYQLGNLVASSASQIEAKLGDVFKMKNGIPNYGIVQGILVAIVLFISIITLSFGPEEKSKMFIREPGLSQNSEKETEEICN